MTSVPPYRIKVPLLLGGPDATALMPKLAQAIPSHCDQSVVPAPGTP